MLLACLAASDFKQYCICTGVTTTLRLVEAAKRNSAELLGVSLTRKDGRVTTKVLGPELWPALEQFFGATDVEQSARFYCDLFGFVPTNRFNRSNGNISQRFCLRRSQSLHTAGSASGKHPPMMQRTLRGWRLSA